MTRLERRVVLAGRERGVIRPLEGRGGGVVIIAARMAASVGLRNAGLLLEQSQTMETARCGSRCFGDEYSGRSMTKKWTKAHLASTSAQDA